MTDKQMEEKKKEFRERERCLGCGCFLSFEMGQEGDGDLYCNNPRCKSNLNDWRYSYEEWGEELNN